MDLYVRYGTTIAEDATFEKKNRAQNVDKTAKRIKLCNVILIEGADLADVFWKRRAI